MARKIVAAAALFGLTAALAPGILTAQAANPAPGRGPGRGDGASTAPAPKNADGKPDISGAWNPNAIMLNVDMVGRGGSQGSVSALGGESLP
jgi:hypothetical protein